MTGIFSSTLFRFAALTVAVGYGLSSCWWRTDEKRMKDELDLWLKEKQLDTFSSALASAGVESIYEAASFTPVQPKWKHQFSDDQHRSLKEALIELREEMRLEHWLSRHGMASYFDRMRKEDIRSLVGLSRISEETLQKITRTDSTLQDYIGLKSHIASLETELSEGRGVGASDDELLSYLQKKMTYSLRDYVSMIILTSSVSLTVMLLGTNRTWFQQRTLTSPKVAIFDFFTGRYPAPQYCTVNWEWKEPQVVGKTVAFNIRFFQKNGKPYPVSNADGILVEIMHAGVKVATSMDYGSVEPTNANLAKVSFTVHKSGEYKISVMIGAKHIKGSPFTKIFEAGPIDASQTGFMNYSSTVVCTAGSSHPLTIETKDSFGNLAAYKTDQNNYFKIRVREAGSHVKYVPATQIIYDPNEKRLTMHITMEKAGCYQATVSYGDVKLKNGEFNILVLNYEETTHVHKNLAKKSHNMWYEARLISCNHEKLDKAKKVYVYISPKQLTLKEFYLKIIGKKLYAFRVCPSTKFHFNGFNNQYEAPVFTIDDGAQPPIVLVAKDRNIIAATFTNYLLKNIGGSETFLDKQTFFNHEVRQLHNKRVHACLPIKIDRSRLLHSSYKATKHFDLSDWCKRFEINFIGEEGLDWGGLRREWFELLCTELFDPSGAGLFTRFTDDSQGLVHPNHKRQTDRKLKYYEFAGKVVGKCLYESSLGRPYRQLVKARFSRSFLAQLIGLRVNYKYFETDDPELFKTKIQYIEEHDINDMDLTFCEEEYSSTGQLVKTVDLVTNGSRVKVTNKNKLRYLDLLAQFRLTGAVKEAVDAFLKGLNELIPDNLLSIFDENELELLMCGTGNYSVADFKLRHTVVGVSAAFTKVLEWFWTIVASFTEEQMARLLQFTTGCSQLPAGGFGELNPNIQLSSSPTYNTLPTAHTCFNQLCLPDYDSIENFHRSLLLAINEGNQGFGMV
ncbi:apoptosis-resistant E3 ubiquitin protein ligase 1-like [Haliotis cracherodii]|uniref:apoptosis-resistant E3 ubiquitin protein ligase 1-like n=1 Tax=Haliotis cracherodii TaxID=6455 RepID=UPI0039E7B5A4